MNSTGVHTGRWDNGIKVLEMEGGGSGSGGCIFTCIW